MNVERVSNLTVASWLASEPVVHLFPLFIAQQCPIGTSLAVVSGGELKATLVAPSRDGMIPSAWLVANDAQCARVLLEASYVGGGLQYPIEFAALVRSMFSRAEISVDRYYVRAASVAVADDPACVELTPERFEGLRVPEDISAVLGPVSRLPSRGVFGLVAGGELISVADAIVDVGPVSTIQQVYTRLDHRGTGNASRLVTAIGGRLGALGKAATYLVAEDNGASVRVAEKSGYSLLGRVGCAQLR